MTRTILQVGLAAAVSLVGSTVLAQDAAPAIAGIEPWKRPDDPPVATEFVKDAQWYANALHNVTEPYPYSLRFLEDQGPWFTPFNMPGMTGPYDIRDWH